MSWFKRVAKLFLGDVLVFACFACIWSIVGIFLCWGTILAWIWLFVTILASVSIYMLTWSLISIKENEK